MQITHKPAETDLWRDTRTLMRNGTLRNLSIEVTIAIDACRFDYGARTRSITACELTEIGIVERGGNVGTDAVLHRFNPEIQHYVDIAAVASGVIPYGQTMQCEYLKSLGCRAVRFNPGALDEIGENVLAVGGSYDAPVASVTQGGLRFKHTDEGLEWEADILDDENGRKILAAAEVAPVVGRSFIDVEASETTQDGELLTYSKAAMRSLIIRGTDAVEGWSTASIARVENKREIEAWGFEVH